MPKDNLKDKLEGNELDLSLNNLDTVPVKELAAIPKATRLDLSCNQLTSLPDNFSSLTHLVKIDLSKNKLSELPHNFGNLQNLQHLDLLGNQLVLLPVSFYKLTKLKWLDLKDNPLQADLKKIAGDCLDENQCKKCASEVLKYLRNYNSELERHKQRKLRQEREEKQRLKDQEEAERERVRQERKQKKLDNRKRKDFVSADEVTTVPAKYDGNKVTSHKNGKTDKGQKRADAKSGVSWLTVLAVFMAVLGVIIGVCYTFCQDNKHEVCVQYWKPTETGAKVLIVNIKTNIQELIAKSTETLQIYYTTYFGNDRNNTKIPPNKETPEDAAQT